MIENAGYLASMFSTFDLKAGTLTENNIFSNGLTFAAHIVLQIKQF
jgi:hypothetical protein